MVSEAQSTVSLLETRATVLKGYECLCYQMAFVILEEEQLAIDAATLTIRELMHVEPFYQLDDVNKRHDIRRRMIRNSLYISTLQMKKGS